MVRYILNPFSGKEDYHCFGCCPDNPLGLKLTFREEGEKVKASWVPSANYQGFTGVLHGGIQATLLDEIGGWTIMVKLGTSGVTSKMEVKYRKPFLLKLGNVELEAVVMERNSRTVIIHGKLCDLHGTVYTEASMEYFLFSEKKAREELYYPGPDAFFSDSNT